MDITQFDHAEKLAQATKKVGLEFNDDGEPTLGFVIVGKDSKEYREAAAQVRAAAIRRQTNRKTKIDRTTEEGALRLDEVLQENEHALALAVVVSWFGFTEPAENGHKPALFTKERLDHMFKVKPTWREEVTKALEDSEGFLPI